jgi:hypothetical protein
MIRYPSREKVRGHAAELANLRPGPMFNALQEPAIYEWISSGQPATLAELEADWRAFARERSAVQFAFQNDCELHLKGNTRSVLRFRE